MIAYGKTDVGKVRVSNQDSFCIKTMTDGNILAVVCDGMGGANAGNVASGLAVDSISGFVERSYRTNMSGIELSNILKNAIISANIEVYDASKKKTELKGMGTTVVAAIVTDDSLIISHVGDSRAYIVSDETRQLTRDHSIVQTLLESGKLTPEEARVHPKKNVITRALGTEEDVLVDSDEFPRLNDNEFLLLCSDGLTNFVDISEIKEIFDSNSIDRVTEVLVARANHNGGGDNITAVTVCMEQKG